MLKIAGQGTTDSIGSYKSSAHVNFYQLRWILVDVTDPVKPVQVADHSTVTGSPTMVIERQFITGDPNFWEPFDTNPIDLKSASGVASSYISGGTFRYTVKDLDSKYEVWLETVSSC